MNATRGRGDTRPRRGTALGVALLLINLPLGVAAVAAMRFYAAYGSTGSIVTSGRTRDYTLFVPAAYDGSRPVPLVVSLHGAGLWGAAQREISRWDAVAEREGFIVVYPSGTGRAAPKVWRVSRGAGLERDVRFISDLIDTLSARLNIDQARIYANGLSNGGGMSFVLSCRLSHRIAAVGMVGAAYTLPFHWCEDRRPVPAIMIHGTADPVTRYAGGKSWVAPRPFPSIPGWAAHWARRNRCARGPVDSQVAPRVVRRLYDDCAAGADVVLLAIQGGGHTWPGGRRVPAWLAGRHTDDIDASSVMWTFFRVHRRQPDTTTRAEVAPR